MSRVMVDEAGEYLEAILIWTSAGPDDEAVCWLTTRKLDAVPMRAGLLVTGSIAVFEGAFGVTIDLARLPLELPVPAALSRVVASITIPARKRITERRRRSDYD